MSEEEIINEIEYRKEIDYDCRFDPRDIVGSVGIYDVVERNGWKGIKSSKGILVPTIYDFVDIVQAGNIPCAIAAVFDKKGVYELSAERDHQIIPCIYDDILIDKNHRGVVMKKDGKEGLFSLRTMKGVFKCEFLKVTFNVDSHAAWAMRDENSIEFLINTSGERIYQSGALMAFESEYNILYQDSDGNVKLLNRNGNIDKYEFRRLVVNSHGRLILSNSRESRLHICDISGYILS